MTFQGPGAYIGMRITNVPGAAVAGWNRPVPSTGRNQSAASENPCLRCDCKTVICPVSPGTLCRRVYKTTTLFKR
jgi:hypothetical protein